MTDKAISPLRRRMIEDMTIRKLAPKTQASYIRAVRNFTIFLGRSPDQASAEDLRRYHLELAVASAWDGAANGAVTTPAAEPLPDDVETLKAILLAERQAHRAEVRDQALLIEKLEHQIARLRHDRFGQSSERRALLDQLELQLFELKEDQAQAAMPIDD